MKEIFEKIIKETNSMSFSSKLIGISYRQFKKYAKIYDVWSPNQGLKGNRKPKKKIEDIFSGKFKMRSSALKKKLIDEGYLENKCDKCENDGKWKNEELVLELDHINGNGKDNRLENLRILCPNCHSQTSTFRGRNTKRKKEIKNEYLENIIKSSYTISEVCDKIGIVPKGGNYKTIKNKMKEMKVSLINRDTLTLKDILNDGEIKKLKDFISDNKNKRSNKKKYNKRKKKYKNKRERKKKKCKCGKEILSKSSKCKECFHLSNRKVSRPNYNDLISEINELGYCGVGRKYGVSDNAIRKWVKNYETTQN